jgi:hypothetical protein
MSIERMAEAAPAAAATGGQSGTGVPAGVRLQILTTEHWSLLATRSLGYTESFSRAGMFLSVLSGAVVALALVAQATDFKDGFDLFAVVLLPVVLFVGIATFVRLVQVNNEDIQWVYAMNRLRHAYLEVDPTVGPYFTTAWHDDEVGMLVSIGSRAGGSTFLHGLITTPGMLAVVDGVLAGVLAAFVAMRLAPPESTVAATLAAAAVAFAVTVLLLLRYQEQTVMALRHSYQPRFPHATDRPELQTDG